MDAFENLGQALRWLRHRRGRRQMDVAREAGITKAMLSAYETGKQSPTIPTLSKILAALGADLQELREALLVHQGHSHDRPQSRSSVPAGVLKCDSRP